MIRGGLWRDWDTAARTDHMINAKLIRFDKVVINLSRTDD